MTELVSSKGNYCAYRKAFSESEGFKIPILGVHLKDLIAVHVVFPDWVEDGKVNIVKMQQLYLTFNELVSLQSAVAQVEPNMDLIYLLNVSSARCLCSSISTFNQSLTAALNHSGFYLLIKMSGFNFVLCLFV